MTSVIKIKETRFLEFRYLRARNSFKNAYKFYDIRNKSAIRFELTIRSQSATLLVFPSWVVEASKFLFHAREPINMALIGSVLCSIVGKLNHYSTRKIVCGSTITSDGFLNNSQNRLCLYFRFAITEFNYYILARNHNKFTREDLVSITVSS
jgi:primosomal replication protein N